MNHFNTPNGMTACLVVVFFCVPLFSLCQSECEFPPISLNVRMQERAGRSFIRLFFLGIGNVHKKD